MNALVTRERSRRWSAPSAVVMPSTVAKVASGQPGGISPARIAAKWQAFLATSGWPRNSFSSSWPVTANAATSPGSVTGTAAPRARSRSLTVC